MGESKRRKQLDPTYGKTITYPDKEALALSIHEAVVKLCGEKASHACSFYAFVGAYVLDKLIPKLGWKGKKHVTMNVGSFTIWVSPDPGDGLGDCFYQWKADDPATIGQEYHAWVMLFDDRSQQVEAFIDFASRHYEHAVKTAGLPWRRDSIPQYIWCPPDNLQQMRIYPKAILPMTELTIQAYWAKADLVAAAESALTIYRERVKF